jgi:putative ABC transport system substrate-binding protein
VDVLVAAGDDPVVRAALRATRTRPIVMTQARDPVANGWVASLQRPGRTVTGVTASSDALPGQRLAVLRAALPQVTHVAVLWHPDEPAAVREFLQTREAAQAAGVQLSSLEVRHLGEVGPALANATQAGCQALLVLPDPFLTAASARVVVLAAAQRLPGLYPERAFVAAGGLMAYEPDAAALFQRAATTVHTLLQGAKPATLPVESPRRFVLRLNRRAATALGLTLPPAILAQAAEILE